jgi:uncharacterized protein (TIGR00255 family)
MTGFARVRETIHGVEVTVSVKTVNHRGLDIHFYTGVELDPFENAMRSAVKRAVARGHIDIRAQLTRSGAVGPLSVDFERLDGYVAAFRQASNRHGLSAPPDLNTAFRIPGIVSDTAALDLDCGFEAPLIALLERALDALNAFREREGAEILTIMLQRAAAIHTTAERIEVLRKGAVPAYQSRLRERLTDLLGGTTIDPQRLVQEAALLADRSDIGEEVERLKIHSRQLDDILRKGAEVGKKLDFLLQEMNRETNTILSKTSGLGEQGLSITELAVAARSDIEKMREQSLNLE